MRSAMFAFLSVFALFLGLTPAEPAKASDTGYTYFEIGDVSVHHNVALLTWVLIQADGTEFARGGDQITVGENGKIIKITTFGPSTKTPD